MYLDIGKNSGDDNEDVSSLCRYVDTLLGDVDRLDVKGSRLEGHSWQVLDDRPIASEQILLEIVCLDGIDRAPDCGGFDS